MGKFDFTYGDAPSVLVFSDSEAGESAARAAVDAAGGRIAGSVPLSEAQARLDDQLGVDAVMVELSSDDPQRIDPLLDRIDFMAAREDVPACVSVPLGLVDAASARLRSPHVALLCQPSLTDRVSALGLAIGFQRLHFADVSAEVDPVRLRRLADEVGRIAQALARLTPSGPAAPLGTPPAQSRVNDMVTSFHAEPMILPFDSTKTFEPETPCAADIRAMIRVRRMRDQYFDPQLFADPAWDMLLDLMAARLECGEIAVSSLCIAAAVPPTTALRWIKTMTDTGLFERVADPDDGRRIFIRLADHAAAGMATYLAAAKKTAALMI
jgi:hypothetical protein